MSVYVCISLKMNIVPSLNSLFLTLYHQGKFMTAESALYFFTIKNRRLSFNVILLISLEEGTEYMFLNDPRLSYMKESKL